MVPIDLEPEELEREIELFAESVEAPVAEGDVLGRMTVSYDDVEYGTVDLLALNDVSASWLLIKQRDLKEFVARPGVQMAAAGAGALAVVLVIARLALASRARRYGGRRGGRYNYNGYRGRKNR